LDVRAPGEFNDNHIENSINIPAPELRSRFSELDPEKRTILICSTGHRSSLGASILRQHGFKEVFNVAGGMSGYSAAGYTQKCRVCESPHGSRYFSDYLQTRQHWNTKKG
jgi:hydroxyacylglutathione hydrolase